MSEKKCRACGATIDFSSFECKSCGEIVHVDSKGEENAYSKTICLKPYYETEFHRIDEEKNDYKGKFNWCSFLFSFIWALTKGLWGLALITLVLAAFFILIHIPGLIIVLSLYWGFRGNYFYYNLIKNNRQFPGRK